MATVKRCKQCGGSLEFNPKTQELVCIKCGTFETFKKANEYQKHIFDMNIDIPEPQVNQKLKALHCESCGAVFSPKTKGISDICEYCGSNLVMDFEYAKESEPDACIPYCFGMDKARELFGSQIKKNWWVPGKFKKNLPKTKIDALYFPAYLFNVKSNVNYSGKIYTTSRDADNNEERHYRNISGVKYVETNEIMFECSSKIRQNVLDDLRPYYMEGLRKYSKEFLMGYSVEYYDKKLNDCKAMIENCVKFNSRREVLLDYHYDGVDYLHLDNTYTYADYSRIILPTYSVSFNYAKKDYVAYLNGQTGKLTGHFPLSVGKVLFVIGLVFALVGLIVWSCI